MNSPTFRDVEQLSAYLDGQLPQAEATRLEQKLRTDPQLADLHRQLSQARTVLRQLPARRAPRNFTLTPQMAGVKAPTPRTFSVFSFASAFASLLLVLTFAANALGVVSNASMAAAPAYGIGGGPVEAPPESRPQSGGGNDMAAEAAAPTQAAEATEAPAAAAQMAPETTPTPEAQRVGVAPAAEPTAAPTEEVFTKQAPDLPPPQPVAEPAPAPPLVAGWLQGGLLALAVLSGGTAWFIRWRANQKFRQKNR